MWILKLKRDDITYDVAAYSGLKKAMKEMQLLYEATKLDLSLHEIKRRNIQQLTMMLTEEAKSAKPKRKSKAKK